MSISYHCTLSILFEMDVFIDGKVTLQHKQYLYYEINLLRDKQQINT